MENAKFVTEFSNGSGAKTVITLDLDLYERAMQIVQSDVIMKEKIILRLGDLHIVFAHIRSIGLRSVRYRSCLGKSKSFWIPKSLNVLNCGQGATKLAINTHEKP